MLEEKAQTKPEMRALAQALDTLISVASALTDAPAMWASKGLLNRAGDELVDITDLLVERYDRLTASLDASEAAHA